MADANLVDFVKAALERGESRDRVRAVLTEAGWPADQIDSALSAFADIDFAVPVPRPRRYGSAREAFLYIVYFSLLGMIAGNTGGLAFAWIDHQFADRLSSYSYGGSFAATGLRWSVASLLVGHPIFVVLGWRLAATKRKDPERRRSRVHAWLTYVTLIFAAGALIGDLVAVVFQFLNGELQARFLSKAAVVGIISAAVLWNYSRDVERHSAKIDVAGRVLAIIATLVVGALVAWAFTVVRSPQAARQQASDEVRLAALIDVTRLVDCHYTYAGALPVNLEAMSIYLSERAGRSPVADGCSATVPTDPITGENYAYRIIEVNAYEICARFDYGWPEAVESDREWRPGGYYNFPTGGARRTLQKPTAPGDACFMIDAVDFEAAAADAASEIEADRAASPE